jgi:hypothetical protein
MKKFFSISISAILLVSMISCSSVLTTTSSPGNSGTAPGQVKKETGSQSAKSNAPGQVKKTTGSQSAAPYAPGQQKKKK